MDGVIMLAIGIALVSLGISMATSLLRRRHQYRVAFLMGLVAFAWSAACWYNVTSNIDWMRTTNTFGADYVSAGYGLLVGLLGGLIASVAALSVWRSARRERRAA